MTKLARFIAVLLHTVPLGVIRNAVASANGQTPVQGTDLIAVELARQLGS